MEDLVESILDYVRSDYTDYAIMINGEWGSGKTHFWNNKIRKKIESMQLNGKRYTTIYMSLYGISNLEEISKKIFIETTQLMDKNLRKFMDANGQTNIPEYAKTGLDMANFFGVTQNGDKIDYIIIDESSQCDILSALPLLYIAKSIIIVGDEKQLSAITDLDKSKVEINVKKEYDYTEENFLSSIKKIINPPEKTLVEHYRCDYNIINYCNKFFYDNQLKIYKDARKNAMVLVDQNKGKYVEKDSNGGYHNYREIKCIDELIKNDISGKFIITPFKGQSEILKEKGIPDKNGNSFFYTIE